ncbi:MAG: hypothetical protein GF353_09370 [Candidatus Lokiarchaeota archaeon]|nr:hypothetical protein [Candidatus Lokiarchaeota archaeon]
MGQKAVEMNPEIRMITKGVDSLYLYLDCSEFENWEPLMEEVQRYAFDEPFKLRGLSFIRMKAWMRTYPMCIKHNQFMFFINRKSAYIKVLSLAFELHGFEAVVVLLCKILDQLLCFEKPGTWQEQLRISRIDVYVDFAYNGDFNMAQFRTKLRKKGFFRSGENSEAVTYYFGSRELLLIRLYVKSEEIKKSGKDYLKSHWKACDCQDATIWRLEFEFHKDKILEICSTRNLSLIDWLFIEKLFAYGLDALEYAIEPDDNGNIYRKPLHPLWKTLQTSFRTEYNISRKAVTDADIKYRFKRARRCVISWLVAQNFDYDDIDPFYIENFRIDRYDYDVALRWVRR